MMKSSRLFKSLQIERNLSSLCCKNQDKHSSHVEVLDKALKGPMRGWTHTGACSTGSIPHKRVGRDGTISHLY